MSDKKDLSLPEALEFLKKGLKDLAAQHEKALGDLKKAEAEQLAKKKLKKEMGQGMMGIGSPGSIGGGLSLSEKKAEKTKKNEYIDGYHANEQDKRIITLGPGKKPVLPGQKPTREDGNDEGSGGQTKSVANLVKRAMQIGKGELEKAGYMGTKPPGGTAGPGTAPPPGPQAGLPPKPKVKKGELNPDKLAERLQGLGHKALKAKAQAPQAKEKDVKAYSEHLHDKVAQPKPKAKPEKDEPLVEHKLKKEHIGFEKLKEELAHKPGVSDPGAVAAAIGRKKYGAARMEHAAAAGKPANKVKKASLGMDGGGAPKGPRMPKAPGMSNPGGTPAGAVAQKSDLPNLTGFQSLVTTKPKPAKDKVAKLPGVKMPGMGGMGMAKGEMKKWQDMERAELEKVAPPGREEQVKELKGKVANPFAVAWASYNKSHKAKKALPDMSGYKSLVPNKPKPAADLGQTNKELKGFQSLAPKPKGK